MKANCLTDKEIGPQPDSTSVYSIRRRVCSRYEGDRATGEEDETNLITYALQPVGNVLSDEQVTAALHDLANGGLVLVDHANGRAKETVEVV